MKLAEMKARETGRLWSIIWKPSDWNEPTTGVPDHADTGAFYQPHEETPAALLYVIADTREAAIEAAGLPDADVLSCEPLGFSGVILAATILAPAP